MKLAYIFSTTKSYYDKTVNRIIKECKISGIPPEDTIIVSSQEDSNESILINGCKVIKVKYTGIHLTPLIYILENRKSHREYTHFCLLHSTSRIGPQFYKKLTNYLNDLKKTTPFFDAMAFNTISRRAQSKDMGILSYDMLRSLFNYFKKIKLININPDSLLSLKKQLISDENLIFGMSASRANDATKFELIDIGRRLVFKKGIEESADEESLKIKDIVLGEEKLRESYYTSLDLYKYQRTFSAFENISMDSDGSVPGA